MRTGLPILLDVRERLIVIVGGGTVAVRKAQGALSAGARRVRVVAPKFHEKLPGDVERVAEIYEPKHLDGAMLIFAATDSPQVNARVVQDARQRGVLVSRADEDAAEEHAPGDFTSAAVHRDGPVTVSVSAGSAALAALIRDGIAARFDPRWARMAQAMRELRPRIRGDARLSPARRRAIFRDLATEDALAAAVGGAEQVWHWLVQRHPDLARH